MQVRIQGKKYLLTAQIMRAMPYFEQYKVLCPNSTCFDIQPSICSLQTWQIILSTLEKFDYQLPKIAKIKSNIMKDYLPQDLSQMLETMEQQAINKLYSAVHFLKINDFRTCIAAFFACKAYIDNSKGALEERAQSLKVSPKITTEQISSYKEKEPNLN